MRRQGMCVLSRKTELAFYARHPRPGGDPVTSVFKRQSRWVPAFAGTTAETFVYALRCFTCGACFLVLGLSAFLDFADSALLPSSSRRRGSMDVRTRPTAENINVRIRRVGA